MVNGIQISDPYADSPEVPQAWRDIEDKHRLESVRHALGRLDMHTLFAVERAGANGHITVSFRKRLNAADRGEKLRAYEEYLNRHVATGLRVYVEAQEDRNRLRQLRGVKVKDA